MSSNLKIITGKTGTPHVSSQQDREINMGIIGNADCVLNVGNCFNATVDENLMLIISDGILCMQGCCASIESGLTEEIQIENGRQAVRYDLVCAKYTRDIETNYENIEIVVLQDTSTAPTGNIRNGDNEAYMPLYLLSVYGNTVSSISQQFTVRKSLEEFSNALSGNIINDILIGTGLADFYFGFLAADAESSTVTQHISGVPSDTSLIVAIPQTGSYGAVCTSLSVDSANRTITARARNVSTGSHSTAIVFTLLFFKQIN